MKTYIATPGFASLSPEEKEFLNNAHSIQADIIKQVTDQVMCKREQQIKDRLSQLGFDFGTTEEFYSFLKQRVTQASFENKPGHYELFVDIGKPSEMLIATWSDDVITGWDNGNLKVSVG